MSDLLPALRRGWWLIVLAVVLGLAAALTWTALTPRTYATSETFFVTTPSKGVTDAYQGGLFSQQRVRSYAVLLADDRLARLVAQDASLGLTAKQIQSRVHAQVVPDSVLLRASVTDTDPGRSQRVASALADQFIALVESLETPPDSTTSAVKVELVAGPELNPSPISPRPERNLGLGLVAGLVLGAAAAVARERLDNTLKTPQALAEIAGGPTLASVPFDGTARRRPLVMGTGAGQSARSEAFRQLRTNVQFLDVDNPVKVLAITSALPAEGKSTAAINLAIAFAETGIGVLLIEADLRRPRVAEYLGLEGAVGLSNVLARHVGVEEVLQPWGSHGLRALPSGFIPPNPSELLGSAAMAALLQQQRGRFDMVIVDTPPLLPVTDA
ncbi:MAG TPA: polysaccharide biosynthesis tyrosine autokinase, partial [Rugosimonospora sp.]|nr:polysaccharide biosynthesis tyrosine autokinase [Rugosimonospora sp.]